MTLSRYKHFKHCKRLTLSIFLTNLAVMTKTTTSRPKIKGMMPCSWTKTKTQKLTVSRDLIPLVCESEKSSSACVLTCELCIFCQSQTLTAGLSHHCLVPRMIDTLDCDSLTAVTINNTVALIECSLVNNRDFSAFATVNPKPGFCFQNPKPQF